MFRELIYNVNEKIDLKRKYNSEWWDHGIMECVTCAHIALIV